MNEKFSYTKNTIKNDFGNDLLNLRQDSLQVKTGSVLYPVPNLINLTVYFRGNLNSLSTA